MQKYMFEECIVYKIYLQKYNMLEGDSLEDPDSGGRETVEKRDGTPGDISDTEDGLVVQARTRKRRRRKQYKADRRNQVLYFKGRRRNLKGGVWLKGSGGWSRSGEREHVEDTEVGCNTMEDVVRDRKKYSGG